MYLVAINTFNHHDIVAERFHPTENFKLLLYSAILSLITILLSIYLQKSTTFMIVYSLIFPTRNALPLILLTMQPECSSISYFIFFIVNSS